MHVSGSATDTSRRLTRTCTQAIGEPHGKRAVSRSRVDGHAVDGVDVEFAAHEVLDRLLGERERGASTKQREIDSPLVETGQQLRDGFRVDATEVEAVGKDDEVGGESIAADVGALPHVAGPSGVAQRADERSTEVGTALVVAPVGTHQDQRLLHVLPLRPGRFVGAEVLDSRRDVSQRVDVATPQGRRSGAGAAGSAREQPHAGRLGS